NVFTFVKKLDTLMKYFYNYLGRNGVLHAKSIYLFVFFSISLPSFSQTLLKGTIKDSTSQESLIGVVVSVDSNLNTTTDLNGRYKISISSGTHTITFSCITYQTKTLKLTVTGSEMNYDMVMQSMSQGLQMTVVSASLYGKNIAEENVSMQVLKPQTIENTGMRQIDEAMNNVPGVDMIDGQANIRGGSGWTYGAGSRVLMLVDGLPEVAPDANDVIWDFLPIEQVQQIEVIKGASSVLYGSSALDGVINVRTAYPTSTPVTTFSFFQGVYADPNLPARDSANWWKGLQQPYFNGLSFMHSQKIKQLDLIVSGSLANEQSYEQGAYDQRACVSLTTRYRFKNIDGLMVGLKTHYMYQNNGTYLAWANDTTGILKPLGGTVGTGSTIVDGLFRRLAIDPFINYYTPGGSRFTLQGRYFLSSNVDGGNGNNKGSIAQSYYYEFQYQKNFKYNITLTAGLVDYKDIITAQLYGNHSSLNQAGYLQLEKKLWKNLTLTGGLRYESYKIDSAMEHSPIVFRAGANYKIGKATYLRASYGEGYRFPSIAERYINSNVGGIPLVPNPGILPETGYSSEIGINQGVRIGTWQGFADLALFETQYKNLINFAFGEYPPLGLAYAGFKSINVENAQIYGAELSYTAEGKIFGLPIQIIAGITYINPINMDQRDTVNKYESTHPALTSAQKDSLSQTEILNYRYHYSAKLGFEITDKKWIFGANVRYTSFMVNMDKIFLGQDPLLQGFAPIPGIEQFRETDHKGDYIIDAHIGYQVSDAVKISFIVKNLLNRAYMIRPALLGPPQNFIVQANIKI
ncbi:MAG TPA: TonB-dependent receptor, partial [Bacteroidia bacterium]|nr:TonB-dependent receptor [Bacteroidia bacterium]